MPIVQPSAETSNNKEALAGTGIPLEGRGNFGTKALVDKGAPVPGTNVNGFDVRNSPGGAGVEDPEAFIEDAAGWMNIMQGAKKAAEEYLNRMTPRWEQAYRAFANQHMGDSKYASPKYRGRSKLFRPKTRSAVHKADATAANSLFSSPDIVATTAMNPADPQQAASAAIAKELLNYRLDRQSGKAGVPWFQLSIGAHQDARLTGICASKQYWEYRGTTVPVMGPDGFPMIDAAGQPVMKRKVRRDRPMIRVYPPELVWRDPAAYWVNQVESASFIALLNPMSVGEALQMIQTENPKGQVQWAPLTKAQLASCRSVRQASNVPMSNARDPAGNDRLDQTNSFDDFNTCWMIEWFVRRDGVEYHFWSAGMQYIASKPVPVEDVYPHMDGERPLVIGYGALEPHKIDPMSRTADTLPIQQEINDLANLTIDGVKETVRPMTYVKRGKNIDLAAIQNRGGDSVALVDDIEKDVKMVQPGTVNQAAFEQQDRLAVDFDDMAGQFNSGSVQTNRALNETVGGLKLINSNANVVGDFDIRIWIETWVEPVLRQVVLLEQYYEDNPTILVVAGEKAQLWKKFGVNQIDDDLLSREVYVNVSAGMGTANPEVKFDKIGKAAQLTGVVLGPTAQQRIKQDALIDEIWGTAGYKNAAEAFFHPGDNQDQRIVQMQQMLEQLQAELADKQADRDNEVQTTKLKGYIDIVKQMLQGAQQQQAAAVQHDQAMQQQGEQQRHDMRKTLVTGAQKSQDTREKGNQALATAKAKGAGDGKGSPTAPAPDQPSIDPRVMDRLITIMAGRLIDEPVPGADGVQQGGMPAAPQMPMPQQAPPPAPAGGDQALAAMIQQQQQQSMMMMQMMQGMAASIAALSQSIERQAAMAAMPKMLVKDPMTGKTIGVRTGEIPMPANPVMPAENQPPMMQ